MSGVQFVQNLLYLIVICVCVCVLEGEAFMAIILRLRSIVLLSHKSLFKKVKTCDTIYTMNVKLTKMKG